MRRISIQLLLGLLLLGIAATATAGTIFKCRQAGGVVSYQDKPCPGRQIGTIRTSVAAPPTTRAVAPPTTAEKASEPAANRPRPTPTGRAPRPSFKCTRPDGSLYFTGDARAKRTLVDLPLDAAKRIALPGAPAAPPGKMWAQDQCENATRSQSCQYYQQQIDSNSQAQASASGDELRKLTREGQRLRAIHNHRCS